MTENSGNADSGKAKLDSIADGLIEQLRLIETSVHADRSPGPEAMAANPSIRRPSASLRPSENSLGFLTDNLADRLTCMKLMAQHLVRLQQAEGRFDAARLLGGLARIDADANQVTTLVEQLLQLLALPISAADTPSITRLTGAHWVSSTAEASEA